MKRTYSLATTSGFGMIYAGPVLAQPAQGYYYGHDVMGWFSGLLMMVLFVALVAGAIVVVFRLLGYRPGPRSSGRALEILNERFARGEIDRVEYEDRRKALREGAAD